MVKERAVKTTNLVLNRGDSHIFDITVLEIPKGYISGSEYHMQGDDTIYFGVMDPHQPFEDALIRKKYTKEDFDEEDTLCIKLDPEDTIDLIPGKYYYSIKLAMDHIDAETGENIDYVITLVNKSKIIICD